jgi:hypothetical protein
MMGGMHVWNSSWVTTPSPSQSPQHAIGFAVGVGVVTACVADEDNARISVITSTLVRSVGILSAMLLPRVYRLPVPNLLLRLTQTHFSMPDFVCEGAMHAT